MRILSAVVISLALVGCSPNSAARQKASHLNLKAQRDAGKTAKTVSVRGQTFKVLHIPGGSYTSSRSAGGKVNVVQDKTPYAMVRPVDATSYGRREIEAAAEQATGCKAKFAAGILGPTSNLSAVQSKVSNFRGWRTDLSC